VVQQNAANAEESASASEEMNAQAEQMKAVVTELVAIVGGSDHRGAAAPRKAVNRKTGPAPAARRQVPSASPRAKARAAQAVIPLEDDQFSEF
jgi:methyl-accepting chemotaxis protein